MERSCLVIIDVQNGFVSDGTKWIIPKIIHLVKNFPFDFVVATKFRNEVGSPYEKFLNWSDLQQEKEQRLSDEMQSLANRVFEKNSYTCFTEEFSGFVKENGVDKLFFVGMDLDCCILKSAADCFEQGINFAVIVDCCASNGGSQSEASAFVVMERLIGTKQLVKMEDLIRRDSFVEE